MATLRTYFGKFESITQSAIESGEINTNLQYNGEKITLMPYCQSTANCCDTNKGEYMTWCVPTGVSFARMLLWGGGGGGAGACCCQQGVPGGSGAFARQDITVSPGELYTLCAGFGGECTASCKGDSGTASFIVGEGLNNFCAEGGDGGKTCCEAYHQVNCSLNACGYWYMDNCNKAQFFGALCGAEGVLGYAFSLCGSGDNVCYWKQAVPYPGGLINKNGGTTILRNQGRACNNRFIKCIANTGLSSSYYNRTVGQGAPSSTACGGGCCCGTWGNPGMIQINYR